MNIENLTQTIIRSYSPHPHVHDSLDFHHDSRAISPWLLGCCCCQLRRRSAHNVCSFANISSRRNREEFSNVYLGKGAPNKTIIHRLATSFGSQEVYATGIMPDVEQFRQVVRSAMLKKKKTLTRFPRTILKRLS